MVENRKILNILTHIIIWIGIFLMVLQIIVAFSASTHSVNELLKSPIPILPGHDFLKNYLTVLGSGFASSGGQPIAPMMLNSLVMALGIAIGKIVVSLLSAYAIVYFRFKFRMTIFW